MCLQIDFTFHVTSDVSIQFYGRDTWSFCLLKPKSELSSTSCICVTAQMLHLCFSPHRETAEK